MKYCIIIQPYQIGRLEFSFAKISFQSSHLGLEFQNRTSYKFAKVLLNQDLQSKTLHVFCCQQKKLPHCQKAGNCIENVVATTYFNGHLPCLIASAHNLNVWDQNGKKKIGICLSPKKYCTTRAFFVVTSESWLLVMASDKMAKRSMSHI